MYGGKASGGEQHLIAGKKWADSGARRRIGPRLAGLIVVTHAVLFSWNSPITLFSSSIKYSARPVACEVFASEAQGRWDDTVSKARGEGKVVILGPATAGIRPSLIDAFQKQFPGISLEYQTGDLASLTPRLRAEIAAEKTSIDVTFSGAFALLQNRDLLEALPGRIIWPEVAEQNRWRFSKGTGFKWLDREKRYAVQTSEWIFGYILLNRSLVGPNAVRSWKDLLRPEWKGKIASHDPRGAGAGQAVANYLLVTFGERFIIDLFKGQDVVLTRSYSQVADWLAQGKYAIGIAQVQDRIESLRKEGIALTADGLADAQGYLTGGFSVIALPKRAPHPNAATVFLNWFLTRPGQEAFHRPHLYPSLRTDVPREYVPEYILPKPQLEYVDGYGEDMIAIQHKLGEQVRELLGR